MSEKQVQTRVQILDLPVAAPGFCAMCGSSNGEDRKFIDFGFQLDWFGAVYFCTFCFSEIAEQVGYVTDPRAADMLMDRKTTLEERDFYRSRYLKVRDAIISVFGNTDLLSGDYVASDTEREHVYVDESEDDAKSHPEPARRIEKSKKPASVKRLDDLFNLGED